MRRAQNTEREVAGGIEREALEVNEDRYAT